MAEKPNLSEAARALMDRLPLFNHEVKDDWAAMRELEAHGLAVYDGLGGSVWYRAHVQENTDG